MEKHKNFSEGNILRGLIGFALPVLFALFLQALYGAVDLLVVGQFATTADVSGVATGSMVTHAITTVVTGLTMGITVLVGQSIGEGNREKAGRAIGSGIFLFIIVAVILSLFIACGAAGISTFMKAPADAFDQTVSYVRICGVGFVFVVAFNVLGGIFRGLGDSKTPLIAVAIACVFNIGLDLLFVCGFHMGAAGAALATVIAQGISVLLSLQIIRKQKLPFVFSKKLIRFDTDIIGRILRLGTPIALQDLLVSFSFLIIQMVVNKMGVVESAGIGIGEKVCTFIMLVPLSYAQSMSAFVAQNIGARRLDRARKALLYGILTSFVVGVAMFFLAFFQGDMLANIFTKDPEVILAAASYLKAYAIDCLLVSFMFCFIGYYNGCGNTFFVMIQGIVGAFAVRIPIVFFMSSLPETSLFLIGLGTPASSATQIVLCLILFFATKRKMEEKFADRHDIIDR